MELKSNEALAASPGEAGANPPPLRFSDALRTDKTQALKRGNTLDQQQALFSAALPQQRHNIFKAIHPPPPFSLETNPLFNKKEFHSGIFFPIIMCFRFRRN